MGDAQGNPYLANLGESAAAMRSYQKAFTLHSALAAAHPLDLTLRRNVAADQVRIADMLWADGQYADALQHCRAAIAVYEELATEDTPAQLEDRFSVTRTLNRMGLIQLSAGNLADSLQLYQRSLSLASDLTVAAPQNVTYRRAFAVAALKIGDVVDRMHDYQRAFDSYSQSERLLRQLSQENPASADLRRTFAFALGRLAIGHLKLHRSAEAVAANRETLAVYQTLVKADPDNVQTQIELADTYTGLADALSAEGNNPAAADAIRQGLAIYARNPGYTAGGGSFATLYLTLGKVLMKTDAAGALNAYRQAVGLFAVEPVRSEDPSKLAESYAGMGDAQAKLAAAAPRSLRAEQWEAARHWYEESLAIWRALQEKNKLAADQINRPKQVEERIAMARGMRDTSSGTQR
jgi:tetratricopeptide (TPR) repeat protein